MSLQDLEKHPPPTSFGLYSWWFEKRVIQKLLPKITLDNYPECSKGWIFSPKLHKKKRRLSSFLLFNYYFSFSLYDANNERNDKHNKYNGIEPK